MVVPVCNCVFIGIKFRQRVLVVDFDAEVVQLLLEYLHQVRSLTLVADPALHHHGCGENAVAVDELAFLLEQVLACALLTFLVLQLLQHRVGISGV